MKYLVLVFSEENLKVTVKAFDKKIDAEKEANNNPFHSKIYKVSKDNKVTLCG